VQNSVGARDWLSFASCLFSDAAASRCPIGSLELRAPRETLTSVQNSEYCSSCASNAPRIPGVHGNWHIQNRQGLLT
jgi:hypothetical protein